MRDSVRVRILSYVGSREAAVSSVGREEARTC